METWLFTLRFIGWSTGVLCLPFLASASQPQLVTVLNPSQAPAEGGSANSISPILSSDGRYVLFASDADNVVTVGGSNGIPAINPQPLNVYLYDRTNQTTTLVSINYSGTGGGNDNSLPVNISTNGRYALFVSSATNMVPNDTNNASDVFVRDLMAGVTVLVSVATNGGVANGPSLGASMTPDGRYVAFLSGASNLVTGDTNGIADVFVRDLQSGTTTMASPGAMWDTAMEGRPDPLPLDSPPDITPDGQYIVFHTTATNLVPGVTTLNDIYVNDLVSGTIVQASAGARADAQSFLGTTNIAVLNYSISSNGQYVAYEVIPAYLAYGETFPIYGGAGLVLRYNLQTGLTDLVSTNGVNENGDNPSLDMTPDGRYVAFVANTNGSAPVNNCILVWDGVAGTTTLASGNLSNTVPSGSVCDFPTLSPDGRFVAFVSSATGLVTNSLAGTVHVYVRDLQAATTTLVDADTNGAGVALGIVPVPSMSDDGQFVAFESMDGSLGPQGGTPAYDVFVRDLSAGTTELISAHYPGLASYAVNGPSMTSGQVVSANGRFVVFGSDASDLVPNDTNGLQDVFVADLVAGTMTLVSVSTNEINSGNGVSRNPVITSDGRYVVFSSTASDLVPGDTNTAEDVFIRDLQAGTTTLVSVNTNGTGPGNADSYSPLVSTNGRFVLFNSAAINLAPGNYSLNGPNLFLRDLNAGTTIALTTYAGTAGTLTAQIPNPAQMTPDGHFIAFAAYPYGYALSYPCYVWDSFKGQTVFTNTVNSLCAISPDGSVVFYVDSSHRLDGVNRLANTNWVIASNTPASRAGLHFSGDGRFLTYAVGPPNWALPTNQVYRYDLVTGSNLLVSRSWSTSGPGAGNSDSPDISADGRYVAYRSAAPDIVPDDFNGVPDICLFDSIAGTTTLVSGSRLANQTANNRSLSPVFGGNSQNLVFETWASDLALPASFNFSSSLVALSVASTSSIQPFLATISPGSQFPVLSWPAAPGTTYLVQYKNNLTDPIWSTLGGDISVVAGTAYLQDLTAPVSQRFYRVTGY